MPGELWVHLPSAVFGLRVEADGSLDLARSAPYGAAVCRRRGRRTARTAWRGFTGLGAEFEWISADGRVRVIPRG